MELSDEQKEQIKALMARFWTDVGGLPWTDQAWVSSPENREATKAHYVNATANDVINVVQGGDNATTTSND